MINLMIVDDEEHVRLGIKSLIKWEAYDICIIAEARDGAEALELLEHHHVDILMTDIRMPEVNGLELIKTVNKQYSHIKTIIMSGFNDFDYAKKALKLGVSDYLLKPSRTQEILDIVLKLVHEIKEENKLHTSITHLKNGFRESLPLLKERALCRLVTREDIPYEKLLNKVKLGGLSFPSPYFGLVMIQIDNYLVHQEENGTYHSELLKSGIKNISEETLSEAWYCAVFEDQDVIVLILNSDKKEDVPQLLPFIEKLKKNIQQYLRLSISVGISGIDKPLNQLRNAYARATEALDQTFFMGTGKVINYEKYIANNSTESMYPVEIEKQIIHSILAGDECKTKENIRLFQLSLNKERNLKDQILKYTFNLYFSLYHFCIERNLDINEIFRQDFKDINQKLAKSNLENIYKELLGTASLIIKQLNEKKNTNKLINSVLDYIRQNYDKDISRETVANKVYISPGYLSLIFKQQLNMSFLDFLHKTRIEKACQLLSDPGKRVADIAIQVGYNDEKYFFQVFKKYMGMTPKQFRNTTTSQII
ncbi:response regulator [Bacillus solitudinis]|uniref:response regulator n=1 Tax=Bacillus solitudinis TaxID=2014074 RepID=UPI000C24DD64|nr:response regulator [Bacillus solitudinis]